MLKIKSFDVIKISNTDLIYIVDLPPSVQRNLEAITNAFGSEVEIDGVVMQPLGYELNMPEKIGILARSLNNHQ